MNANSASKVYAKVGAESGVIAADPHKLISMLYQGALQAIANARNGMMRIANTRKTRNAKAGLTQEVANKCAAISKAIDIIDAGLNASLDKKVGGELAQNLSSLYDYMCQRLLAANLNNDMAALDEVARLLNELKGAWEVMRTGSVVSSGAEAPPKTAPVAHLQPPAQKVPAAAVVKVPLPNAAAAPQPKAAVVAPVVTPQQRVAKKVQTLYGR